MLDPKLKSIDESAWIAIVAFGLFALGLTAYLCWYSISIDGDRLRVRAFYNGDCRISNISRLEIVSFWHGKSAYVTFDDGTSIRMPTFLKDFDNLVGLLRASAKPEAQFVTSSAYG
jgi:hypothetical protein